MCVTILLPSIRAPAQITEETNINILKILKRLTQSNSRWRHALLAEDNFSAVLTCLDMSSKQQALHTLYLLDNLVPPAAGLTEQPILQLFSEVWTVAPFGWT